MDTSSFLWGLLFGSIGLGFFVYGRRQKTVVPLVCGVALMIFPYFVSNTVLLVILGLALIAIPYFVRMWRRAWQSLEGSVNGVWLRAEGGAEVVIGDLTRSETVAAALQGVTRMFFAMRVAWPSVGGDRGSLRRKGVREAGPDGVERMTGIPPQSIETFVAARRDFYLGGARGGGSR
jgi:hypothetical protein